MSTIVVAPEPEAEAGLKLLTVADVAAMPDELPSGPVKYELIDGNLSIMAPAADEHSSAQLRIGAELLFQGERKGHGVARCEVGVVVQRNPDCVFEPDAAFIANRSLPLHISREGYLETIPDIVVEVRSKNDSLRALHRKAERYLQAGVQTVWLLDSRSKSVTVFDKERTPATLSGKDILTTSGVIPGFEVRVADLFVA